MDNVNLVHPPIKILVQEGRKLLITLRQVDAFRSVMITGTITGASVMLSISQPAVTRLIQDLERVMGFDLFVRRGRHIVPSDEGR